MPGPDIELLPPTNEQVEQAVLERELTPIEKLKRLSATRRLDEMRANLENESYVIPDMALEGQITLFFGWPNTGKTLFFLRFLMDGIRGGTIEADRVIYINADDSYRGLLGKAEIANEFGFAMVNPAEANVSPSDVLRLLDEVAQQDGARDQIIVLDTLKKFVDMMSKAAQSNFFEVLRRLGAKNATILIAGHANKHLDADGKLVYEGTSDTMNDIDASYAMYRMTESTDDFQVVEFRREKARGSLAPTVTYRYDKTHGIGYADMLESITKVGEAEAEERRSENEQKALMEQYEGPMFFVQQLLAEQGTMIQSELCNARKDSALGQEFSDAHLKRALTALDGLSWKSRRNITRNNALEYDLIGRESERYREAKNCAMSFVRGAGAKK